MFTNESVKWIIAFVLLTAVTIGGTMVAGRAIAVDDEASVVNDVVNGAAATMNPDPNAFTSDLDSLRQMGQAEAQRLRTETRIADVYKYASVFDHTGNLDALREYAATIDLTAGAVGDNAAVEFASQLDHLRETGQQAHLSPGPPTGEVYDYTSELDSLRAKGATVSPPDHYLTGVVISNANEFTSYLDNLREIKNVGDPVQQPDANEFTSYLDGLRRMGQNISAADVAP